jgi:hypothetical protein
VRFGLGQRLWQEVWDPRAPENRLCVLMERKCMTHAIVGSSERSLMSNRLSRFVALIVLYELSSCIRMPILPKCWSANWYCDAMERLADSILGSATSFPNHGYRGDPPNKTRCRCGAFKQHGGRLAIQKARLSPMNASGSMRTAPCH